MRNTERTEGILGRNLLDFEDNLYGHMLEYKPFLKTREKQIREDKRYAKVRFSKMRWS